MQQLIITEYFNPVNEHKKRKVDEMTDAQKRKDETERYIQNWFLAKDRLQRAGHLLAECTDIWVTVSMFLTPEEQSILRKINTTTRNMYWSRIGHLALHIQCNFEEAIGIWPVLQSLVYRPNTVLRTCTITLCDSIFESIQKDAVQVIKDCLVGSLTWNIFSRHTQMPFPLWIGDPPMGESKDAVASVYRFVVHQWIRNIRYKLSQASEHIEYVVLDRPTYVPLLRDRYGIREDEYDVRGSGNIRMDDGLCDFGSQVTWNSVSVERPPKVEDEDLRKNICKLLCSGLSIPVILETIKHTNIPTRIFSLFWDVIHAPHVHLNPSMWKKCKAICVWFWEKTPDLIPEKHMTKTYELALRPTGSVSFSMDDYLVDDTDTVEVSIEDMTERNHEKDEEEPELHFIETDEKEFVFEDDDDLNVEEELEVQVVIICGSSW